MSQFQALTKVLSQVVDQLQEFIKKTKQESPTVDSDSNSNSQSSYIQFIKNALNLNQTIPSLASSQTLYHDLTLILQLSSYDQITPKTFEQIAEKLEQSPENLQKRYEKYLKDISQEEKQGIIAWIKEHGIIGELILQNGKVKVQMEKNEEKEMKTPKRPRSPTQNSQLKVSESKKRVKMPEDCQELSSILKCYSKLYHLSIDELTEKLHQLSGDVNALEQYLEKKDGKKLWSQDEDNILKLEGSELELLKRYRGEQSIRKRKQYLGMK